MPLDLFQRFGTFIYKYRWLIIFLWLLLFVGCLLFSPRFTTVFKGIGFKDLSSESAKASELLNKKVGYSYNQIIVMFSSKKSFASHPEYLQEIKSSLANLNKFPVKHQIIYPSTDNKQIANDKRAAYALVLFNSDEEIDEHLLDKFKSLVKTPKNLKVRLGGEPIFLKDTKTQTQHDMFRTEYIAMPITLITMLIVFGSFVAALLPIVLGGMSVVFILACLFAVGQFYTLSVFTINTALLLGLCLSLDYALLIINRFRDELRQGEATPIALKNTQATAGKSVFFSGIAVFISLSALMLFPINVLFSVGVGGLCAAFVSVGVALILLPAVLAVLGPRINSLAIRSLKKSTERKSYWHWSVNKVVKRPWLFFILILALLLLLGYPFLYAKIRISDFKILPKHLESREVFDIFKNQYSEGKLKPIFVIVQAKNKDMLTEKNIGNLYDFSDKLKKNSRVKELTSIVNTTPRLNKMQYQMLYTKGKEQWSKDLKKYLEITTKDNLTVMTLVGKSNDFEETKSLIERLRSTNPGRNLKLQITGSEVNIIDVKKSIMATFPYAFLWIVGFTYLILLFFLRSVFLPIKAILTTILSLCASYGVLVFVFQEGYLHSILNFEPQQMLDITLLIIIFCALFGVSMDYEVFLLTRIKEYYEKTENNVESIVLGIERSSKIITSAAIIVILLCIAFMAADVVIVKAFGMGIAVAVFVDAFIIRTLFVPAIMTLMGKWNWYLPRWLDKILPKISFDPEH